MSKENEDVAYARNTESGCKTDKSVTFVHTVRINKLEANLAVRPDKVWTFLFFNNVFSGILLFYIIVNS